MPDARAPLLTALGSYSLLTLPADNHTWSVTVYISSRDQTLKRLRHPDHWTRLIASSPMHAHWLDGEPITDVDPMAGVLDHRRRLVACGQPLATGVALLADSWACTNPSQGRGITLGLRHARRLRDLARTHLDDPHRFATAWDELTETELTPWYDDTVAADRARVDEMDALREGMASPAPNPPLAEFLAATEHDPDLFRAFLECQARPHHPRRHPRPARSPRPRQAASRRGSPNPGTQPATATAAHPLAGKRPCSAPTAPPLPARAVPAPGTARPPLPAPAARHAEH